MNRKYLIFLITLNLIFIGFVDAQKNPKSFELPKLKRSEEIVCHKAYCLVYSEDHEQAKWVAYVLKLEMLNGDAKRSNKFKEDPKIKTKSANDNDYKGSGYDRGHLAPAGDMSFSEQAMQESFYYSNISPQEPSFNRGIWKKLESEVRSYVEYLNEIYIVTGPVLTEGLPEIGENGVAIPEEYYKAALFVSDTCVEAIAFIMPNKKISSESVYNYAISVNELEKKTKINFFHNLPFFVERSVEKRVNIEFWENLK
ncbi:MAG: DNA/RNA non-specific endonuclease [Bacteroidales bacterium]|nr:DNA/RNA non-specific endonuclease [Bacteroidales bacterium]MDD4216429.1 DNA/RNA non-specific endonuclease [Bacteroidales bacterium]MDY0143306.1 DNA/RNA non-specific endonuclease [Bacteroidales bacterium]